LKHKSDKAHETILILQDKINNLESDYDFLKQQLETKQNKNKFGLNMLNLNNLNNNNNMNNNNNINNNSNFNNLNNNSFKNFKGDSNISNNSFINNLNSIPYLLRSSSNS